MKYLKTYNEKLSDNSTTKESVTHFLDFEDMNTVPEKDSTNVIPDNVDDNHGDDADGDVAFEVDLDDKKIKIKENIPYEFLNVHFKIKYNDNLKKYYSLLQYPNIDSDGTEMYPTWVIYGNSMEDMINKLRFKTKMYIVEFGELN